jgi:hypothetical protein
VVVVSFHPQPLSSAAKLLQAPSNLELAGQLTVVQEAVARGKVEEVKVEEVGRGWEAQVAVADS